jgi:hypothetical protein
LRLPLTIWRFTLRELWRLLVLTAGVLVTVISFALALRLTAEGRLDPLDTFKYMFMAMPPMLQYALPFAAGFGATLSYHRMSQDNELKAAAAGGVSHFALLVPALLSGLILSAALVVLTGNVIPRFLQSMERMITRDATRIVKSTIDSGRPLDLAGTLVYADSVRRVSPERADGPTDVLVLSRVFALDTDPAGQIRREASASQAVVELSPAPADGDGNRGNGFTEVALTLKHASVLDRAEGLITTWESLPVYAAIPSVFNDDPKYLTDAELRRLPDNPDVLNTIDMRRRDLAYHLAERDVTTAIDTSLRSTGSVKMKDEAGRSFTIRAAGLQQGATGWELLPLKGASGKARGVEVELRSAAANGSVNQFTAAAAGLLTDIGKDRTSRRMALKLEMSDVTLRGNDTERPGVRETLSFGGLIPNDNPLPQLLKLSSAQLLDEVARRDAKSGTDTYVARPADELRQRLKRLGREIVSKQHERLAFSAAGLVMVLAGALSAMRLGGSMPLTVYLWSFFPALLAVITIAAGQQMTHRLGAGGLFLLWGGVGILGIYSAMAFLTVRRH